MSFVEKLYLLLKAAAFLLFCFVGGGWLIYDGVINEGQRVTFGAVFPGAAAITAGVMAVGLMHYFRRRSRAADAASEPALAAPDERSGVEPESTGPSAPGKPWRRNGGAGRLPRTITERLFAGWFELTPLRRQLLLAVLPALLLIASLALRVRTATDDFRDQAVAVDGAAGDRSRVARNPQSTPPPHVGELERIKRATDAAEEFAEAAGSAYSNLQDWDRAGRDRLDAATEGKIASVRELRVSLDAFQEREPVGADRVRVLALRKRCSDLIERLSQVRGKSKELGNKK